MQTGTAVTADVTAFDASAGNVYVRQGGFSQTASVAQTHEYGSTAFVIQGAGFVTGNSAKVAQTGSANSEIVTQTGRNNVASIAQR